jgi:hypothetical protein
MKAIIRSACVVWAFVGFAAATPASATVLYSLTGTVGDQNWDQSGDFEIDGFWNLNVYIPGLQYHGLYRDGDGPGGPITITYQGPALQINLSDETTYLGIAALDCYQVEGCTPDQLTPTFDEGISTDIIHGPVGVTAFSQTIDSSFYDNAPIVVPDFSPFGSVLLERPHGITSFVTDYYAGLDSFGQAFSLIVTRDDVGGVPEPAIWAMMLAGFGLIGAAMRRRRFFKLAAVR